MNNYTLEESFEELETPSSSIQEFMPSEESVSRKTQRYLQRGAETLAGLPGDIVQLIRDLGSVLPGEPEPYENKNPVKKGIQNVLESFPTSQEFAARSAEIAPQLEPQTPFESTEDEFVQDFTSLALPIKGRIPFGRALGLSLLGNLGKQGAKELGLSENLQDATKLGLMLFGGFFGKGRGINKYIKNSYDKASEVIPQGQKFNYSYNKLNQVESLLKKGSINDAKKPALNIIEEIKMKSPSGQMLVEEGMQFERDINREIRKASGDKQKRGYLKQLLGAHSSSLEEYAEQNPTWAEEWNNAKQAYKGIATSENIQDFIKRNVNLKNIAYSGVLLGLEESALPGHYGIKLGSLGSAASLLYAKEIGKRLSTNAALRKYYLNVMKASLNENKAMLTRNLKGLERVAKKEFENNPLPVFEISEKEEEF